MQKKPKQFSAKLYSGHPERSGQELSSQTLEGVVSGSFPESGRVSIKWTAKPDRGSFTADHVEFLTDVGREVHPLLPSRTLLDGETLTLPASVD